MGVCSLGLLAALTVAAYSRSLTADFVYEDHNPGHEVFRQLPLQVGPRMLLAASYRLDAWRGGGSALPFHVTNLALHLTNGVLLYVLVVPISVPAALVTVALFWLHPLQTEAVAYISGRGDVLVTTFILLLFSVPMAPGSSSRAWVAGFLGLCALAVKEIAVVGVLALLSGPLLLLGGPASAGPVIAWAIAVVSGAWLLIGGAEWHSATWQPLAQLSRLAHFVELAVWPQGQSIMSTGVQHPVLVGIGLVGVNIAGLRWVPWTLIGVTIWLLAVWGPRLLVPSFEPLHEHHAYLAMVGICVGFGLVVTGEAL